MSKVEVFKEFTIDSAHRLPNVPVGHKCQNVHGHTYRIKIVVESELDAHLGWVIDFQDINKAFQPVKDALDHRYLNDIVGLENPTAEQIAIWIWNKIRQEIEFLKEIWVFETPSSGCVFRG